MIVTDRLTKQYGALTAVRDLSFEIAHLLGSTDERAHAVADFVMAGLVYGA